MDYYDYYIDKYYHYHHYQDYDISPLVIDNGSFYMKAGFGGDDAPRAVFPTIVGRHYGIRIGMGAKDAYVGDEAQSKRGILNINYPIQNGIIIDWNDMEKIWHHTFYNELCVAPEEHQILLSFSPLTSKNDKEKISQIMFETFSVPAIYLANSSILSLLTSGRLTGIVCEIGDQLTSVVPIYLGIDLENLTITNKLGGKCIIDYLMKLMNEKGYSFTTTAEREIIRDIKEKLCYIPLNYKEELEKFNQSNLPEINYELPYEEMITIGNERIKSCEILFQPNLIENKNETIGIDKMIYQSIIQSDKDIQKELFNNIILSGGSTMFPGIKERIENELNKLILSEIKLNVIATPERKYSVWIGGSILSSLSTFQKMWITKEDYFKFGNKIINKLFF